MKKSLKDKNSTTASKNEIVLNPTHRENKSFSEASDTAVVTFGRMNPPTIGHLALVEKMLSISLCEKAQPLIFLSHSYDPQKNPLAYDEKLSLVRKAFGEEIVVDSEAKNLFDMLKEVNQNFKNVIVVVGEDRIKDLERITTVYNGKDFHFENVQVVNAGLRDPDSDGVEGMSASKMRDLAVEGNLTEFREGLPSLLQASAEVIINMIREGMNLSEELNKIFEEYLDEAGVLTVAGRRKKAISARKYKTRLKIARARVQRRIALSPRLKKRTARASIRIMRGRLAGGRGKSYSKLSAPEKASIDRRVRSRSNIVKKLSQRLMPATRRKEFARFKSFKTRKEDINLQFNSYLSESPAEQKLKQQSKLKNKKMFAKDQTAKQLTNAYKNDSELMNKEIITQESFDSLSEKALNSLISKAESSGLSVASIVEFYVEGATGNLGELTIEQAGFAKVNEAIAKNKTNTDVAFEKAISEISTHKLAHYTAHAHADSINKHNDAMDHAQKGNDTAADASLAKSKKRIAGVRKANDKLHTAYKKTGTIQGRPVVKTKQVAYVEGTYMGTFDKDAIDKHDKKKKSTTTTAPINPTVHPVTNVKEGGDAKDYIEVKGGKMSKAEVAKLVKSRKKEMAEADVPDGMNSRPSGGYTGDRVVHGQKGYKEYMAQAKRKKAALDVRISNNAAKKSSLKETAGLMGTDALRKRYEMDTPGQTKTGSYKVAVDGVPGKNGIEKPRLSTFKESVDEAVFDAATPKKGIQRTRQHLSFKSSKPKVYKLRQKQDLYKKDDPQKEKEKKSESDRRYPEWVYQKSKTKKTSTGTPTSQPEKKEPYQKGGERSTKYGGDEHPITKH